MSYVSPLNTITIDCSGNVSSTALLLADVDLNKSNELLVGTHDGELFIYKFIRSQNDVKLWRRAQGLGFITAITVGNLLNKTNETRPIICVVNAEGAIHLFSVRSSNQRNRVRSAGGTTNSGNRTEPKLQLQQAASLSMDDEHQQQLIQSAFSQQLIVNPKNILIEEYNEMEKHLVVGYCDRTIRIFVSLINEDSDGRFLGRFVLKNIFNTVEQIHTIHSKRLLTKDYELIVSQPGGNLLRFNPNDETNRIQTSDVFNQGFTGWTEAIAVDRFCEDNVYATVCHDRVDIYSNHFLKLIKSIMVNPRNGYLSSLRVGPLTNDCSNQLVVVSSIDGDTFVIDQHEHIIRFRPALCSYSVCNGFNDVIANNSFSDLIQAFAAGEFGENHNFCFIYVLTHHDKIIVVDSIDLNAKKTNNIQQIIENHGIEVTSKSNTLSELLYPVN